MLLKGNVTQKFVKTILYLQIKDVSRESLILSLKSKVCESSKNDFFKSVSPMWSTYRESSATPNIKTWYSGPSRTNISVLKVCWLHLSMVFESKV